MNHRVKFVLRVIFVVVSVVAIFLMFLQLQASERFP
jgi:hypothetical protein